MVGARVRTVADKQTTADVEAARKQGLPTEAPQLKIEIPANRLVVLR